MGWAHCGVKVPNNNSRVPGGKIKKTCKYNSLARTCNASAGGPIGKFSKFTLTGFNAGTGVGYQAAPKEAMAGQGAPCN